MRSIKLHPVPCLSKYCACSGRWTLANVLFKTEQLMYFSSVIGVYYKMSVHFLCVCVCVCMYVNCGGKGQMSSKFRLPFQSFD